MKPGQTVYLRPLLFGNAYEKNKEIVETTIETVDTKYVHTKNRLKFDKEGKQQDTNGYCGDYKLYYSLESYNYDRDKERLWGEIRAVINRHNVPPFTNEILEQIKTLLCPKT